MHKKFLQYLKCPATLSELVLESTEEDQNGMCRKGYLISRIEPTIRYPIQNYIPRFVGREGYTQSFGFQWKRWSRIQFDSENVGTKMEGASENYLVKCTLLDWDRDVKDKVILEVGCGCGRFAEVILAKGGTYIGIDMSAAVEVARQNFACNPDVLIVQADAMSLPIRSDAVDGAFSIGVLHHTPNPAKAFCEMARILKLDGWIACMVYGMPDPMLFHKIQLYRQIFKKLGHKATLLYSYFAAAVLYPLSKVPILGSLLKLFFMINGVPNFRWRVLDNYDSISPAYQSHHETREVYEWFKAVGLDLIEPGLWGSANFVARKLYHL